MNKLILIGYGSVGRRHAKAATNNGYELVIIDESEEARKDAMETYPDATVASELNTNRDELTENTAGIIATWAPTHSDYFHKLADKGVKQILCEKPMANSLAAAQSMCDRADRENIRLLVHHSFRYGNEIEKIRLWEKKYDLGTPVRFLCEGGALGLINNGVHYKDLSFQIFDDTPTCVVSTAQSASINPRSDSLDYYGGTTILKFKNDKEAVFSFNNGSSLTRNYRIDYRDAVILVDDENEVSIRHRDPNELEEFPSITRYGSASEELYTEQEPFTNSNHFERVRDDLYSDTPANCTGVTGQQVLQACIGSLISSNEREFISLPIKSESDYWEHEWGFN